ncbi:MAG: maltotransferase domain-containing protein [Inquilinaceae bacterium]
MRRPLSPGSAARLQALQGERLVITDVTPEIDGGRYPAKREVGDLVDVSADIVCDGHFVLAAVIRYRPVDEDAWREAPMALIDNDRWSGAFVVERNTRYVYTIEAWVDLFASWRRDLLKKVNAGQNVAVDLAEGRDLLAAAHGHATGADKRALKAALAAFEKADHGKAADQPALIDTMTSLKLETLMAAAAERTNATRYKQDLELVVDPVLARYAAWYEMFWRSQGTDPHKGATVDDCIARLPYIRDLGFNVVYLVPIHPIGTTNRKGRNNALVAGSGDPGSPYAIGSDDGGHDAINPDWGTLDDFRRFVAESKAFGLEVAIDFAIQCSPDHPWIREHKDWFAWRPDGTIRFAENPPKKYEDIVNVEFYGPHQQELWLTLRDIVQFWIDQGVTIFRVDNPHTKSFAFWEWLIRDIQERHPEAQFLAEAFTRPKMMKALAKLGFTQSYSYFTWRNEKAELIEYLEELTQGPEKDYMRANFFTNTPDILPVILQEGGRPAFLQRVVLAATLSSVYGIYNGYELCEATPVPGKEEYLNSEKYQYKVWDWDRPGHIREWITVLNRIRRNNPALHEYENLRFCPSTDDHILVYCKATEDNANFILVAVNLDPHHPHETMFELPLWRLGLPDWETVEVEELFSGHGFTWTGKQQHLWIDNQRPAFMWRLRPA